MPKAMKTYEITFNFEHASGSATVQVRGFDDENAISNAMQYVNKDLSPVLYHIHDLTL